MLLVFTTGMSAQTKSFKVPDVDGFSSAAECREYKTDVLNCSKYYLTHTLDAPQMKEAGRFIIMWMEATSDFNISLGEPAHIALMKCSSTLPAYTAACIIYGMAKKLKEVNIAMHVQAMQQALKFYENNKEYLGKVDEWEVYVRAKKDGTLKKLLKDEFEKTKQNENIPEDKLQSM